MTLYLYRAHQCKIRVLQWARSKEIGILSRRRRKQKGEEEEEEEGEDEEEEEEEQTVLVEKE